MRAECLDWLLIVGRGHPEQVLRVYAAHYNTLVPTGPSGWNRRFHGPLRPPSHEISAVWTSETDSAACSTSTTDKLHERISAPHAFLPVRGPSESPTAPRPAGLSCRSMVMSPFGLIRRTA